MFIQTINTINNFSSEYCEVSSKFFWGYLTIISNKIIRNYKYSKNIFFMWLGFFYCKRKDKVTQIVRQSVNDGLWVTQSARCEKVGPLLSDDRQLEQWVHTLNISLTLITAHHPQIGDYGSAFNLPAASSLEFAHPSSTV